MYATSLREIKDKIKRQLTDLFFIFAIVVLKHFDKCFLERFTKLCIPLVNQSTHEDYTAHVCLLEWQNDYKSDGSYINVEI